MEKFLEVSLGDVFGIKPKKIVECSFTSHSLPWTRGEYTNPQNDAGGSLPLSYSLSCIDEPFNDQPTTISDINDIFTTRIHEFS